MARRTCSVTWCDADHYALGWCHTHYSAQRRGLDPDTHVYTPRNLPAPSRFWPKVDVTEDCWMWLGTTTRNGYGQFRSGGRLVSAHRAAWELHHGSPVPEGAWVVHRCGTRSCVRPDHLDLRRRRVRLVLPDADVL